MNFSSSPRSVKIREGETPGEPLIASKIGSRGQSTGLSHGSPSLPRFLVSSCFCGEFLSAFIRVHTRPDFEA